ncbi:hypothetical protein ACFX4N_24445 [Priestia sp. YIM B13551]
MLQFINNKGKKVMELHDNGELNILNEDLKTSFSKEPLKTTEEQEKENE